MHMHPSDERPSHKVWAVSFPKRKKKSYPYRT